MHVEFFISINGMKMNFIMQKNTKDKDGRLLLTMDYGLEVEGMFQELLIIEDFRKQSFFWVWVREIGDQNECWKSFEIKYAPLGKI